MSNVHRLEQARILRQRPAELTRIPTDAEVQVMLKEFRVAVRFGSSRLEATWSIINGPHRGVELPYWRNCQKLPEGDPRCVFAGGRSKLYRDYWCVFREHPPGGEIVFEKMRGLLVVAAVADVIQDADGHPLDPELRYSKIERLLYCPDTPPF